MSTDPDGIVLPFKRAILPSEQPAPDAAGVDLVGPVLDGELLDPEQEVVEYPVASPGMAPWEVQRNPEPRPVIPAWLADPTTRRAAAHWAAGAIWHRVKFHAVRSPVYLLRFLGRAPVGAARLVGWLVRWLADAEARPVRLAAAASGETAAYLAARRMRDQAVKTRAKVLGALLLAVLVGYVALRLFAPPWAPKATLAVVVVGLAVAGRKPERPIVTAAIVRPGYERLTEPIVLRALAAAGLGGKAPKVKDGQVADETAVGTPTLPQPVARIGDGWLAVVDLPRGRTFGHAAEKRAEIAGALDVAAVQVFLESVETSARRVVMWVADRDPYAGKPNRSPLAKCPPVTVWEPQRIGMEPRGRQVRPTLLFNAFLIGAIPRQGKTYLARTMAAPAILDPHCDLTVLDLKGGRDWKATERAAVTYRSGDDDDDVEYALAVLQRLKAEAQGRFAEFRNLSDAECPESKLTQQLAARGMLPHLIVLDEVQNLLRHEQHGKAALPLLVWLAKTAPAAGFMLMLATQRPAAEVIPADLRDNISVRLALKTMDWRSSDTILGASAASIGIESFSLLAGRHAGVAVVRGVDNGRGGDHQTVRSDLVTAEDFARICAVGRQRREDAGTLRGLAAGEVDAVQVEVSLLDDVRAVWPGAEPKVWAETLCERLADFRPDRYDGVTPDGLTKLLGRHGVGVVQINRHGTNRRGYAFADVEKAGATC